MSWTCASLHSFCSYDLTSMRCDDVQNVDSESLKLSQVGLRLISQDQDQWSRQEGWRVACLCFQDCWLSGFDWLGEGVKLLGTDALAW